MSCFSRAQSFIAVRSGLAHNIGAMRSCLSDGVSCAHSPGSDASAGRLSPTLHRRVADIRSGGKAWGNIRRTSSKVQSRVNPLASRFSYMNTYVTIVAQTKRIGMMFSWGLAASHYVRISYQRFLSMCGFSQSAEADVRGQLCVRSSLLVVASVGIISVPNQRGKSPVALLRLGRGYKHESGERCST